jgi:hypothetical protein
VLLSVFDPNAPGFNFFGASIAPMAPDVFVGAIGDGGTGIVYLFQDIPEPSTFAIIMCATFFLTTRKRST